MGTRELHVFRPSSTAHPWPHGCNGIVMNHILSIVAAAWAKGQKNAATPLWAATEARWHVPFLDFLPLYESHILYPTHDLKLHGVNMWDVYRLYCQRIFVAEFTLNARVKSFIGDFPACHVWWHQRLTWFLELQVRLWPTTEPESNMASWQKGPAACERLKHQHSPRKKEVLAWHHSHLPLLKK